MINTKNRFSEGGNIRFKPDDCGLYRDWLAESCRRFGVACWA
jgi:hypothetical protein